MQVYTLGVYSALLGPLVSVAGGTFVISTETSIDVLLIGSNLNEE